MGEILSVRDVIKNMEWEQEDKDALIEMWAEASINGAFGQTGKNFFQSLVRQTNLTNQFRAEMADPFTGNASWDARALFDWARGKGTNPADPRYTTLGSVMSPTLLQFGVEQAHLTAALIIKYGLIVGSEERQRLVERFQIPLPSVKPDEQKGIAKAAVAVGPDFKWVGPDFKWADDDNKVELQGLFRPDPVSLDVGFLKRALVATSGVCRVEIDGAPAGTGFLVAPDLVVTNYHVLGQSDAEVEAAAPKVTLRFGALINGAAQEDEGQVATVEKSVSKSPIEEHDFVVLRADASIRKCVGVKPITLKTAVPALKSDINMIHHSGGRAMGLQFSPNGVSTVMADQGKIQYASRTEGGSSGSPCFDDEFTVIAIHHAARSTVWGVAGEGILASALYEAIKQFLDGGDNG
jgi:V8-like Glu-specific endopeptidase